MTIKNPEIYNLTETLPKELTITDKRDLRKKLEEGIKDSESRKVCSIDEVFEEIESTIVFKHP